MLHALMFAIGLLTVRGWKGTAAIGLACVLAAPIIATLFYTFVLPTPMTEDAWIDMNVMSSINAAIGFLLGRGLRLFLDRRGASKRARGIESRSRLND